LEFLIEAEWALKQVGTPSLPYLAIDLDSLEGILDA